MRSFGKRVFALAILLCFIVITAPLASAEEIDGWTGMDGIWLEEGPFWRADDYSQSYVYQKIGYTHWDRSAMGISILTPIIAGGSGWVKVLPDAGWGVPYNFPDFGYIVYEFYPSESIDYWNNHGYYVNPGQHLVYRMESTTSVIQELHVIDFPWE